MNPSIVSFGNSSGIIKKSPPGLSRKERKSLKSINTQMKKTYHLGIIDYLQEYNTKKRIELKMKSLFVNSDDVKTISVADPKYY